jgi:hypothetical protein
MPDVYIDRWLVAKQQKREQAVWVAVEVPENCPRPERKLNARPTKLCSVEQPELGRLLYGFVHQNAGTTSGY